MRERAGRLELPGYIQIEVTSRCNLSCAACPHGARGIALDHREMSGELFDRIVESTLRPDQRYHLQGWGEPLLRHDLPDLARSIADRGGIPSVTTNGTLVTTELAERLIGAGLDFITISLAAGRPEQQVASKPGAELGKILEAFRKLKRARRRGGLQRPLLAASFELTRSGIGSLPRAVKLVKRAGAERIIAIHPIVALAADQQANLLAATPEGSEKEAAIRSLRRAARATMWRSISFYFEPLQPKITAVCREDPLGSMFVSASGDISPCAFLGVPVEEKRISMGNLRDSPLDEIWNSRRYVAFRQAYLARKAEAEERGPLLRGELESPLPEVCRGCLRARGY
jgi:radical SAM protein with 4Fe4S-binding SPASM domain